MIQEQHTYKVSFKSNSIGAGGLFGDCQNKPKEEEKEVTVFCVFKYTLYCCYIY